MGSVKEDIAKCIKNRNECLELMEMFKRNAARHEESIKLILHTVLPDVKHADDIVLGVWECDKSPTGKCVYINTRSFGETEECAFCGRSRRR